MEEQKQAEQQWNKIRREQINILKEAPSEENLWQAVMAFQDYPFKTVTGLPFQYTLKTGKNGEWTKELWIDRREKSKSLSIGDSRIYRMHDGKLEQLSTDHTFRRPGHMEAVPLTEYLGKEHQAEFPENSHVCVPYKKGDRYLICSDGLTDMLEESKIKSRMEQPVEEAVTSLIEETIRMGADDNTTIILAEVESETDEVQNGSDAIQSKSDAVMGKQIEYIQDGAEITSEEWIMQLQQEKYRSFGFEYKNWKNENLIFYRTDQDTNEKHYYSNFVGIVRWADKMLLSFPKSVKLDQSEGYLKKLEMLKVYAKLLDLYLADVWEAAERNQKCKPKKAPWNMVSQSVEQWCAQTEKEQADTAEVQIIAAVSFFQPSQSSSSSASSMEMIGYFSTRALPVINQLLGCINRSCLWQFVLSDCSCLPLRRSCIHSDHEVASRLITGFFYCFQNRLDRFFIGFQCRCKTALITNRGSQSSFF